MSRKSGDNDNSDRLSARRLDKLTSTISELFDKAVANEKIMRRYQQFELMLLDTSSLNELFDLLLRNACEFFSLNRVELVLFDPQDTLHELLDNQILPEGLTLLSDNRTLLAFYGRRPQVHLVVRPKAKKMPLLENLDASSVAALPLVRQGVLIGSLHLGADVEERFSQDKSTDFIAHLASVVAVCLENSVNHERLHRLSMLDMLTQVKNRRAFHRALFEEVSRAGRAGSSLSLLFVDLDHFKQINDRFGHLTGDKVLKVVAQQIQTLLRRTDHVCRYGGEEFALILPNCGRELALEVAERIRERVGETRVVGDSGEETSVTLSIGVTCWLEPDEDSNEELLAQRLTDCSDRAVYQAKANGRNCVQYIPLLAVTP